MDKYEIITDNKIGIFEERIIELNKRVADYISEERNGNRRPVYVKILLSDAANQENLVAHSPLCATTLLGVATTIVQQPPLNGSKIALIIKTSDKDEAENIFHSLRLTNCEAQGLDSYQQTRLLFDKYIEIAKQSGLTLEQHCIRTWIYVRDIDANYKGVVKARNDVFDDQGLTTSTHYIASTGIGGRTSGSSVVAIDFLTCPNANQQTNVRHLQALDHLNPTHEYGVAFERGTRITDTDGSKRFFISGTASIDAEGNVMHIGNIERQTERLLDNIEALLKDGEASLQEVRYFIVYLRDAADYSFVENYMARRFPSIPHIITLAEVCRPTWLIEMECVATKQ